MVTSSILVLRTWSRSFPDVVKRLKETYPAATIDVLSTHPEEQIDSSELNGEVICLPQSRISLREMDESLVEMLKNRNYDLVVVMKDEVGNSQYVNVERVALSLSSGLIIVLDDTLNRAVFSRTTYWFHLIKKRTMDFFCLTTILTLTILGYPFYWLFRWRHRNTIFESIKEVR